MLSFYTGPTRESQSETRTAVTHLINNASLSVKSRLFSSSSGVIPRFWHVEKGKKCTLIKGGDNWEAKQRWDLSSMCPIILSTAQTQKIICSTRRQHERWVLTALEAICEVRNVKCDATRGSAGHFKRKRAIFPLNEAVTLLLQSTLLKPLAF